MGGSFGRREFLKHSGLVIGAGAGALAQSGRRVQIVLGGAAPPPVLWAAGELRHAIEVRGVTALLVEDRLPPQGPDLRILAAPSPAQLKAAAVVLPAAPESLGLASIDRQTVVAAGSDPRGTVYALLELADRVLHGGDPFDSLAIPKPEVEHPANSVRSIARLFVSDVEDKPWFNDREMWPAYLSMLAAQRFNRFALMLGIGYDFLREVTDAYFLFAYPFFLAVPGYNVRAVGLPDPERDRNLAMLKFISEQTVARGLEFQLGIWTHGYQWTTSPHANYTIDGLTAETHARYSRDALSMLLRECPAIGGVTFRIHGESGVPEGSYDFWKTVFDGVANCGRKVEIDMHSKGIDAGMIDVGLATGMPVKVSPKFWAEHLGLPYHQAAIREQEMPKAGRNNQGFFALSSGSRSFTRYGYADLLRDDRRYAVLHRIWPGTQRLLLWGDPVTAAAYSRAFGFCGSAGVEICEPLSFKGRRGSGIAGDRCGYADASLRTRWDWEKYLYGYRVWGRLLYNPESGPDAWQRFLRRQWGDRAPAAQSALASASRILPLVTAAHLPSAANNNYWPEMYTNQSIVTPNQDKEYTDTFSPRTFGSTGALDPQLFSRVNDYADELLQGERGGKYSPVEVARWLDDLADTAARPRAELAKAGSAECRRWAIDVMLQAGLGWFFAAKLRAAVLYAVFERTEDREALEAALKQYRAARESWAQLANLASGIYLPDVTAGELTWLRGHWLDRLPAIDADIAAMARRLESAKPAAHPRVPAAIAAALSRPNPPAASCSHTPPAGFLPREPVPLEVRTAAKALSVRLYYRHVDQAERFETAGMQAADNRYRAAIPAAYTDSPFPLQYYFEVREAPDRAWLYPGLAPDFTTPPYFVLRRKA